MNPLGLKNTFYNIKKSPIHINRKFRKKYKRVKSVNAIREKQWDDRFIYDKIPNYDSSNDKNVLINIKSKCNSSRKKLGKINRGNPLSFKDNSLYLYRPLSNKTTILYPMKNGKNVIKTISAKARDLNFKANNASVNADSFKKLMVLESNIKNLDLQNININSSDKNNNNNFSNINLINLNNIIKLWDELYVINNYRKLFCVIYKELDDEDKEELYQKETNELISLKNDIFTLKKNIEQRLSTINEIYELNTQLNTEIINNENKSNDNIINEISNKIQQLREHTVKVCKSMKKLKLELFVVKNLDKYDIKIIAEKFNFDQNYLIKMKGELNFLRDGFAKYYFNINNDQTPFLLKASEPSKIGNDKDPFVHIIPLNKELKKEINECSYYIYQELIAYQNEKYNNKILRCISPLKRIILKNNEHDIKIINGKEEKDTQLNVNCNVNNNDVINNNTKINIDRNINSFVNLKNKTNINNNIYINNNLNFHDDISKNKNNYISNDNIIRNINNENNENKDENVEDYTKFENEDKLKDENENENENENNNIYKDNTVQIIQDKDKEKQIDNPIRNNIKHKTSNIGNKKEKERKVNYKNIFLNYKINASESTTNKRLSDAKTNNINIEKLLMNKEKKSDENNKNDELGEKFLVND